MTTLLEVIQEANDLLLGGMKEQITRLDGAVNTSQEQVTVDDGLEGIARGDLLEIDGELMYVTAWDDATNVANVMRAFQYGTAAAHLDNAVVTVNPIMPAYRWVRHINNELRSLSSPVAGLFRVEPIEFTYNPATMGFNLTGLDDAESIINVTAEWTRPGDFVEIPRQHWSFHRDMNSNDFASGYALRLNGAYGSPGRPIRVLVRKPFALVANMSDIVESVSGLPATAIDLLAIGATIRAVETDELHRNKLETQPIRKLGDVPPGALNQSAAGLRSRYTERRSEERARMIKRYGL